MLADFLPKMKRGPQIITKKDAGLILSYTGVTDGWKVIEAGCGSGGLTLFLTNSVVPSGKVYSYDNRKEHIDITKTNLDSAGLSATFRNEDITKGIKEKSVDLIVLDMPTPWLVSKHAKGALKHGGFFVCYIPSSEQVKKTVESMRKEGFENIEIVESIVRNWKSEGDSTRPENTGLMHTGFLVFSRKF